MRSLLLLFVVCIVAIPVHAQPTPDEVWERVVVEELPQFQARKAAAAAKTVARQRWLDGKATYGEAFVGRPVVIGSVPRIRAALVALDERAVARELERQLVVPLTQKRLQKYQNQREGVLKAEAKADELERRMWTSLLAVLSKYPALSDAELTFETAIYREKIERLASSSTEENDDVRQQVAVEAAKAEEALHLMEQCFQHLRLSRLPGKAPELRSDRDIALLTSDDASSYAAAARLRVALPLLQGEQKKAAQDALTYFWSGPPLKEAREMHENGEVVDEAGRARWAELRERAERQSLTAMVAVFDLRLAAVKKAEAAKSEEAVDLPEDLQAAKSEAQRAQEEADLARADAASSRDRLRAGVLSSYAAAQKRRTEVQEVAADGRQGVANGKEMAAELKAAFLELGTMQQMSSMDPRRSEGANQLYAVARKSLKELVGDDAVQGQAVAEAEELALRSRVASQDERRIIEEFEEQVDSVDNVDLRESMLQTLSQWGATLDAEEADVADLVTNAATKEVEALNALDQARLLRRSVLPYVSTDVRIEDSGYYWADLVDELTSFLPSAALKLKKRVAWLFGLPLDLWQQPSMLFATLINLIWSFVVLGVWWWARSRTGSWSIALGTRLRTYRHELRLSDVMKLKEPLSRFLAALADLGLGRLLVWSLDTNGEALPELSFALLVYLWLALYRAMVAFFDLSVVKATEVRPALLVLGETTHGLLRTTIRWFLALFVLRNGSLWVLTQLRFDAFTAFVSSLFSLLLFVLLCWSLWTWEPHLRQLMRRRDQASNLVRYFSSSSGVFTRIPRAGAMLGFFVVVGGIDLFYALARDGSGLAWAFNAFSRLRMTEEDQVKEENRPPEEFLQKLRTERTELAHLVERPEPIVEVDTAFQTWKEINRRGLVAVVGPRGSGKTTTCDAVEKLFLRHKQPSKRLKLTEVLGDEQAVLRWLANGLEIDCPSDLDEMVEKLGQMEPLGIILQGIHHAFSRRVGGFDAISTFFYLLNSTSDRHFWAVAVHKPAWDYWSAQGSLVDCGVFRTVITLAPFKSTQLRELTVGKTGSYGFHVDYQALVRRNALGADPEVEKERAIGVFYRLLAEASDGVPEIAMALWAECLELGDEPRVVRPRISSCLAGEVLEGLSDNALFVLVALRLQDEVGLANLAAATNLPLPVVRSVVRDLLSRGLVEVNGGESIRIPIGELSAVSRTLRRRHFLHLGRS